MTTTKITTEEDLIHCQTHYLKDIVTALKQTGLIMISDDARRYQIWGSVVIRRSEWGVELIFDRLPSIVIIQHLVYLLVMMLNKMMRTTAFQKGYTLNEYGLYRHNGDKITIT